MWKLASFEETLPFPLLDLRAVTGLIDSVSFLSLGHVIIANRTGNEQKIRKYFRMSSAVHCRGVAQPGSAPALGAGGPRFKSGRPDH